jgi:hypothetical protein
MKKKRKNERGWHINKGTHLNGVFPISSQPPKSSPAQQAPLVLKQAKTLQKEENREMYPRN